MQGLWEDICSEEIFQQAWEKVRINMGSPGSDRVSVEEFESNLSGNLELLLRLPAWHVRPQSYCAGGEEYQQGQAVDS